MKRDNEFTGDRLEELAGENRGLREALEKLKGYNEDIAAGRINYRPEDHISVAEAALSGGPVPPAQKAPQYDYRLFVSDWLGKHEQHFGYLADMLKDFHELIAPVPPSAVSPQDRTQGEK